MKSLRARGHDLRRWLIALPWIGVSFVAVQNYIRHQSANQAGSVAFSLVLSIFPGFLLLGATSAFFGKPGTAAGLARRLLEYAPDLVAQAAKPVIDQLMTEPNRALVAIGSVATVWTASSGLQSVRTALNRAYGVEKLPSFWRARLKVTLFTLISAVLVLLAFSSVVILPLVWQLVDDAGVSGGDMRWVVAAARYALAYIALAVLYASMYGYLTDIRQRLRTVVPGALVGALLWLVAAAFLSHALRSAGKLALVYGSFAGTVATLVFLYASAVTLIYGAEFNAVLRQRGSKDRTRSAAQSANQCESSAC
ncbi:MAG: YihY/virulence factor BrkB family protein [Burkholderiales bacterium]